MTISKIKRRTEPLRGLFLQEEENDSNNKKIFIWDLPEEEKEFKQYCIDNPKVKVNVTTEKTITENEFIHICEKEEE